MKQINKVNMAVFAVVWGIMCTALAVPQISNVTMQQVLNSRKVEITYNLTGDNAIITLAIETNGVPIGDEFVTWLTGDVNKMIEAGEGVKTITWNAGYDWPENMSETVRARVTAWSGENPPQVMVMDLSEGASAESYPVNYYPGLNSLLDGINNPIYKNDYLVLRKIPGGSFTMSDGSGPRTVTLTQDFYIGVYQVTQGQCYRVIGGGIKGAFNSDPGRAFRPMETITYNDIRGVAADGYDWPNNGHDVSPTSFMGLLSAKTGGLLFDLPTEAQWEYACRAGTTTYYNDGNPRAPTDGGMGGTTTSNVFMNALGRYAYNGGKYWDDQTGEWKDPPTSCGTDQGTAIVGSYIPNAWGLYDMHGNVDELCLDYFAALATLEFGDDPQGPTTGGDRVIRGGNWGNAASNCRSVYRTSGSPRKGTSNRGFRVLRLLP